MTTEITSQLPPCPLPDCEGGEHRFHNVGAYPIDTEHDCAREERVGYRCYSQHRPGLSEPISLPEITDEMVWRVNARVNGDGMRAALAEFRAALFAGIPHWEPIEIDEIKPGMRLRATTVSDDCVITRTGVARHTKCDWFWYTEDGRLLTGWANQLTCEVDPTSIPDPDAELIEKIGKAIHDADEVPDEWGDEWGSETCRKLARAALDAVRAHDEAVSGDE